MARKKKCNSHENEGVLVLANAAFTGENRKSRRVKTTSPASSAAAKRRNQSHPGRRRRDPSPRPAAEDGDEGSVCDVLPHERARRARETRRPDAAGRQTRNGNKRKRKRGPSNDGLHSSLRAVLWLAFVGMASNRAATVILNSLFVEDVRVDQALATEAATRGGESQRRVVTGGRSLQSAGSYTDPRQPDPLKHSERAHATSEREEFARPQRGPRSSVEAVSGRAAAAAEAKGRAGEVEVEVTRRFSGLRERLLTLYAERVPSEATNSSGAPHPLYNPDSPQYRALDWLANVDGRRLRHSDPGLVQRFVLAVTYFATGGPLATAAGTADPARRRRGPWRHPTNFLAPTQ